MVVYTTEILYQLSEAQLLGLLHEAERLSSNGIKQSQAAEIQARNIRLALIQVRKRRYGPRPLAC